MLSLTATAERIAKVGRAAAEDGWDTATWQQVGQTLNQVARDVRSQFGLKAVFHHHMGTYVETPQEVDALLANTGADLIGLCLDTGHYAFGGGDPVELVARAGERIPYLHFKDIDPQVLQRVKAEKLNYHQAVAADIYCRLGQGCARLPELIGRLKMQHYDGWAVVEQDVIAGRGSDPFGSAVRSREAVEGWLAAP